MRILPRLVGVALLGFLAWGCAPFNGKLPAIDLKLLSVEDNPVTQAPITVFLDRPEVVDDDDEKDFTPIAEAFALSLRQRLDEYLCAGRKVFGTCVDRPAEGAYRMALRVVVDDYRAARGGFYLFVASVFLPPLLGMAWGFPVCPGTCTWHLDLALYSPAGEQVWKRTLDPGKGWASCASPLDMARNLGRRFEEVIGELSRTAAGHAEAAARAREAEVRRLAAAPAPGPAKAPIIAVFTLEDRGARLGTDVQDRLSEYLASAIAASGRYKVIPRAQLKERLGLQKTESYKACYDQNCQIELGKELAAEKSLSTQVIRLGARCMVTAVVFDLKTAASEGGASQEGGCTEDELVRSMKEVVAKLTQAR